MVKVRQDAWLEQDDQLLADTVLRHVREGSTQLSAFEEVGDALNRTAAACGFRWNAVVRQEYEGELSEAKKERKQTLRVLGTDFKRRNQALYSADASGDGQEKIQVPLSALSLDTVIAYLIRMHHNGGADTDALRWRQTAKTATEQLKTLEAELEELKKENRTLKDDYEQFVQIMNRARRLIALNEESEHVAPVFKMEPNGNLVSSKEPPISH
ncbi:RsfA family transcriptional regulator [Sporosarcina sp. PTS2304]|uniref:RsfA family transcriptional regulator n=1 Tax=Sporosarcina sp. PTS2304 TaxID=2283194 RepID=UPI000E0CD389|nr:RsfA family transcriptional regulator [Sporosarcina sp. PTS2304]AXI01068.1 RsfA family transcriptional regulator [Sporosarcina sp. PTS2304]